MRYKLFTRVCANIGVYTSGNELRMGKGKGSFDYWAARVAVSKIIFEIKGELHEKVVKDALRLAAAKMPGTCFSSSSSTGASRSVGAWDGGCWNRESRS